MSFRQIDLARAASAIALPAWMSGRLMRIFIAGLIFASAAGYILQTNQMSTSGYQMHALEQGIAALGRETQRLATEAASYQSLTSIQKRLAELPLVPVTEIIYVKGTESVVKR